MAFGTEMNATGPAVCSPLNGVGLVTSKAAQQVVRFVPQGAATLQKVDGSTGRGPLHVVRVSLRPMEIKSLRR
jgi:hypothetical protein